MTMIDRQAAIDSIHKTIYGFLCACTDEEETPISEQDEMVLEINKAVCNGIKALPAKERKTGKWIKDIYGNVICSECRANRRDNRIGHIAFCNSCGAKMEVEE